MSEPDPPGPLLAAGRTADVYDIGGGRVLRRYHAAQPGIEQEAELMRLVAGRGFPVPEVVSAGGRDLVMARVDGPTMLEDLRRRPASLLAHARRLAHLQQRLAEIPAPAWLMAPGWTPDPTGDRVLHLDLNPTNVLLSAAGPVVIDWTDAAAGPAGFDAAMTFVELSTLEADGGPDRAGRWLLVEAFRRIRGRALIAPYVGAACDHRLADPHLTPAERVAVGELRKRIARAT